MEMKIDGVKRDILIDSGATTEMVEENVPYLKEKRVSESVEYADGLREKIEKKRLIELETIDGFRFKIWALVVNKLPERVILGNTFLNDRAIINYKTKEFIIEKENEDQKESVMSCGIKKE